MYGGCGSQRGVALLAEMVVVARSPAGVVLLLAALLLACTATGEAATGSEFFSVFPIQSIALASPAGSYITWYDACTGSSTICDTAKCGKGTCSEVPGIIPLLTASYKCTCDPGWEQPTLFNLAAPPFAPCIIPNCKSDPHY
jgi:hypothetical protein